jgi:transketolase
VSATTSLREALGRALARAGGANPRVAVLDSDVGHPTKADRFQKACPQRYVQGGISEQNLVGVAAGLATCGWLPVLVGFASFLVRRCFDQIYCGISFPGLNVKLVGCYTGFTTFGTGATHQTFDDVSIMGTLPNVTILSVGDPTELEAAVGAMLAAAGPVYLRVGRIDQADAFFPLGADFRIGELYPLDAGAEEGGECVVLSTGIMTGICRRVVARLRAEGRDVSLVHVPTLKPFNRRDVAAVLRRFGRAVTVEDQMVCGGLGGRINELIATEALCVAVRNLGVQDRFGKCGKLEELYRYFGLSEEDVYRAVLGIDRK